MQSHRGAFDPGLAIRLDDLDFFACGHPVIDRLIDEARSLPDSSVGARISADAPPGIWIEVIWRIRATLVITEGVVLRHLVGPDGEVRSSRVTALPLGDRPIRAEPPPWASEAIEASKEMFIRELAEYRAEFERRFEEIRKDRMERLNRMYDSQRERLALQIQQAEEWFAERADGRANEKDLRVMPARRGRLEKDRKRLESLEEERYRRLEELQRQQLDVRGEVLSAAVVVGE